MAYKPRKKKSKDNPYTLGFDENNEIYTITFKDNKNILFHMKYLKLLMNLN